MNILGIGFLSDASAAVLKDGVLVSAISEERLNRVKLWHGVPEQAIEEALRLAGLTMSEIDLVATHGKAPPEPSKALFDLKESQIMASGLDEDGKRRQVALLHDRYGHEKFVLGERTPGYLEQVRSLGRPMVAFEHHLAHAACGFFGSGWDDCLILTADGWGEDASAGLWQGRGCEISPLALTPSFDSLGYFYGSITKALGFTPHRHEGKVLGLAAYQPHPASYATIRSMIDFDPQSNRFIGRMEKGFYAPRYENPVLSQFVKDFSREDVSAAAQIALEEVVTAAVSSQGSKARRLALAGGVFANVKLNQRLAALDNVEEVYVFPNMGDGGLSVGAAWLAYAGQVRKQPEPPTSMYLGTGIDNARAADLLAKSGLAYRHARDIGSAVGELLAEGRVVMRCAGRMEFGPRALGHRSILFNAGDPSVNDWLNSHLNRSEFMPFAPATLADEADASFCNLAAGRQPAKYMAMTFDCSEQFKKSAPAAVHVDGTARPQLVSAELCPDFHAILSAYRRESGQGTVVNTSFNMHEEPIVRSEEDALRAFLASGVGVLALGDFLVENSDDPLF